MDRTDDVSSSKPDSLKCKIYAYANNRTQLLNFVLSSDDTQLATQAHIDKKARGVKISLQNSTKQLCHFLTFK